MMRLVLMGDLHYHEIDKSIPGFVFFLSQRQIIKAFVYNCVK
jgi:hypothetical protein